MDNIQVHDERGADTASGSSPCSGAALAERIRSIIEAGLNDDSLSSTDILTQIQDALPAKDGGAERRHARIRELNKQIVDALAERAHGQELFDKLHAEYELLSDECFTAECFCVSEG